MSAKSMFFLLFIVLAGFLRSNPPWQAASNYSSKVVPFSQPHQSIFRKLRIAHTIQSFSQVLYLWEVLTTHIHRSLRLVRLAVLIEISYKHL
jgi:hypothetical protein